MADLLTVRDLKVSFSTDGGIARVLDGVRLDLARGEVLGLVGESGCGKTTLARTILGVLPAPAGRVGSGSIMFRGEDLLRKDPAALNGEVRGRAVTFIPQDPYSSFNPVFSVGTQIMELMKWKSPLLREGGRNGRRPRLLWRYPRERFQADRQTVLDLLRAVQIPDPEDA
ncbi:MAG: ABC transporter ATP-binding protein, partial [Candidatus Lambdaproteobacteria bacterium]|nr:ABC transporter ATP-binding protein [Candidatus Lambdaproteobacteria bacterium]